MRADGGRHAAVWATVGWLVAATSIAPMLSHSWVPLDEGAIALSGRMVAAGYLPHRDFAYPYTALLAYWNALGLRLFGPSMLVPRWQLFAAFLAWLPAIWSLARRFASPPVAAATVVLSAWWSLLIYPAAMPTWYLLFLTTWSLLALARWADDAAPRWLWLAGACAGVAMTIKQTGVYTLVGAGLGVLAIEQSRATTRAATGSPKTRTARTDPLVLALLGMAALVPAFIVRRRGLLSGELVELVIPLLSVLAALVVRGQAPAAGRDARRAVMTSWSVLTGGAVVPLAALMAWYGFHDALGSLYTGALLGGAETAATIGRALPSGWRMAGSAIPVVVLAWTAGVPRTPPARLVVASIAAVAVCAAAMEFAPVYRAVWYAAMLVAPVATGVVAWRVRRPDAGEPRDGLSLAMAAAAALLALNAFPYAAPNYFAYSAPLFLMVAIAASTTAPPSTYPATPPSQVNSPLRYLARSPLPLLLALGFAGWFHRIGSVHSVGEASVWWDDAHALSGPAGGVRVPVSDSAAYARLRDLVTAHGGPDAFAAGPELPALYLLAGTTRLVPQPYLLVADRYADSTTMARLLDTEKLKAVAINDAPQFLPRVSTQARAWLEHRYPFVERIGDVEFRWR